MKGMVSAALLLMTASLVPQTADAQAGRTDTVFAVCGYVANGSNAAVKTEAAKVTLPWMPEGQAKPGTADIIAEWYRHFIVAKGASFWKQGCGTGANRAEAEASLHRWVMSYAKPDASVTIVKFKDFWPEFMTYLSDIRRDRRSQFTAESAG